MDEIQSKLVEFKKNYVAVEVCLDYRMLKYSDIILYLQYDIPMERSNSDYKKLKRVFKSLQLEQRVSIHEQNDTLKTILQNVQNHIVDIEKDGNEATKVYKKAYDVAGEIIKRLDEQKQSLHPLTVPYFKKAANE